MITQCGHRIVFDTAKRLSAEVLLDKADFYVQNNEGEKARASYYLALAN